MVGALKRYATLLLEWNRSLNLTGARSRSELEAHLGDAERFLKFSWSGVAEAIDIGSGGGLPGIPLAVWLPDVRFALLEADRRKAAFLQHAAGQLSLPNVEVLIGRAETLAHEPGLRERFDRALSRATARPAVLLELALPFVRPGGDLIAAVGAVDSSTLEAPTRLLGGENLRLEASLPPNRYFLVITKRTPSPARYPRRPGLPTRRPLT